MSDKRNSDHKASVEFIGDLTKDIDRLRRHAKNWSRAAYWCYGIAIAASAAATLISATNLAPQPVLAVLAAIPGIALLVNSVFVFEAKTRWYWGKVAYYGALLNRLKYEGYSVEEASQNRREFDEGMQKQYPRFGVLPTQGSQ